MFGPIDRCIFLVWVRQYLVLALAPGDIFVMGHLSSHNVKCVREAIESVGAEVRYLPPNSSELNPIGSSEIEQRRLLARCIHQRAILHPQSVDGIHHLGRHSTEDLGATCSPICRNSSGVRPCLGFFSVCFV